MNYRVIFKSNKTEYIETHIIEADYSINAAYDYYNKYILDIEFSFVDLKNISLSPDSFIIINDSDEFIYTLNELFDLYVIGIK